MNRIKKLGMLFLAIIFCVAMVACSDTADYLQQEDANTGYENDGVTIMLDAELPIELNEVSYDKRILSTVRVDEGTYYKEGYQITLELSGEKVFDCEGNDNLGGCRFNYRLLSEDRKTVIDSGRVYTESLKVGEKFCEKVYFADLESEGTYILELFDYGN